jgi:ComEC/Rec2-related protein
MRLTLLFCSFFLGLIVSDPSGSANISWTEALVLLSTLAGLCFITRRAYWVILACSIMFILGVVWITWLPTWPRPLAYREETQLSTFEIIGQAVSDGMDTPSGRYLPVRILGMRTVEEGASRPSPENGTGTETGNVLIRISRYFTGVQGATYRARGRIIVSNELLRSPICARYRPRAVLNWGPDGEDIVMTGDPPPVSDAINRLRYLIVSHLSWGMSDREGELVTGIVCGRRSRHLDGEWTRDFYQAGLSHLIVASGAQVSLLFLPVLFLIAQAGIHIKFRTVLLTVLGILLLGFTRLLGAEPSILRAAVMGILMLVSIGLGRRSFGLAALSTAGLVWLIQNPLLSRDTGFLLSIGSCFGMTYYSRPLMGRFAIPEPSTLQPWDTMPGCIESHLTLWLRRLTRFLITCAVTTVSAQLGAMPILAVTLGRLSISGVLSNLFAVPLGQIILGLGALSGISGFMSPGAALLLNRMLGFAAGALMTVAHDFARIPCSNAPVSPPPVWTAAVFYLGLAIAVELSRRRQRKSRSHRTGVAFSRRC